MIQNHLAHLASWKNSLLSSAAALDKDQIRQTVSLVVKEKLPENKVILVATVASGLVVTSLAYYTIRQWQLRRKFKHIPGPDANSLRELWFGNIDEFADFQERKITVGQKVREWNARYGPIYKIQVLNRMVVHINDPEYIKNVLIDNDFIKNREIYDLFGFPFNQRFVGRGIVTEIDRDKWRKKRALLNPAFHRNNIEEYTVQFNEQGDVLMKKLRSLADGKTPVNMLNYFNRATLDVIANVAFGLNINSIEDSSNTLNNHMNTVLGYVTDLMTDPLYTYKPSKRQEIKKGKESIRVLRDFAREKILDRFKEMQSGDYAGNDILSIIFKTAHDDNTAMEALIDEFLTIFMAGQETTANALSFCVLELARNPECLKKIREEVDQVLGSKSEITNADLIKLEYTNCVFKEALRLWPPVNLTGRSLTKDIYLGNYFVPKGTTITICMYANCRDPKNFPEPDTFKPERFLNRENIPSYVYFPFSIGPRNCIGQNFAQIEGKIILAKFVQNFDFELEKNQTFDIEERVTIRPKDGCKCILTLRN